MGVPVTLAPVVPAQVRVRIPWTKAFHEAAGAGRSVRQNKLGTEDDTEAGMRVAPLPCRCSPSAPKEEEQSRSGGGEQVQLGVRASRRSK